MDPKIGKNWSSIRFDLTQKPIFSRVWLHMHCRTDTSLSSPHWHPLLINTPSPSSSCALIVDRKKKRERAMEFYQHFIHSTISNEYNFETLFTHSIGNFDNGYQFDATFLCSEQRFSRAPSMIEEAEGWGLRDWKEAPIWTVTRMVDMLSTDCNGWDNIDMDPNPDAEKGQQQKNCFCNHYKYEFGYLYSPILHIFSCTGCQSEDSLLRNRGPFWPVLSLVLSTTAHGWRHCWSIHRKDYTHLPENRDLLQEVMGRYWDVYLPGATGLIDVVHCKLSKCPSSDKNCAKGKEGYPTLAFQCISNYDCLA